MDQNTSFDAQKSGDFYNYFQKIKKKRHQRGLLFAIYQLQLWRYEDSGLPWGASDEDKYFLVALKSIIINILVFLIFIYFIYFLLHNPKVARNFC